MNPALLPGSSAEKWASPPPPFTNGRPNTGGVDVSDVQKLKTLDEEHSRLKRMYADLAMDNQLLRNLFSNKGWALPPSGNWPLRSILPYPPNAL